MGVGRRDVGDVMDQVVAQLHVVGMLAHEKEAAYLRVELLGLELDGESHQAVPTSERLIRSDMAISVVLRRRRLRGDHLKKLLGHLTFVFLLRRPFPQRLQRCLQICSQLLYRSLGDVEDGA